MMIQFAKSKNVLLYQRNILIFNTFDHSPPEGLGSVNNVHLSITFTIQSF